MLNVNESIRRKLKRYSSISNLRDTFRYHYIGVIRNFAKICDYLIKANMIPDSLTYRELESMYDFDFYLDVSESKLWCRNGSEAAERTDKVIFTFSIRSEHFKLFITNKNKYHTCTYEIMYRYSSASKHIAEYMLDEFKALLNTIMYMNERYMEKDFSATFYNSQIRFFYME